MRRSSAHPSLTARAALLCTLALAGSDCTGTPLPEPPDELPRPDVGAFLGPEIVAHPTTTEQKVTITTSSGGVAPGATVWAVNLDAVNPVPVETTANALGGFNLDVPATNLDRVRILARTETRHSPPLDFLVMVPDTVQAKPTATPLGDTRLGCLLLNPPETVVLSGKRGTLTLNNRCSTAVTLAEASLLFGDQGIALQMHADSVAPGKQTTLTFTDSRGPGPSERLEILLLEVETQDGLSGRYAIDVFSALK